MPIWNSVVAFFNSCTRGEIIGIIAIIVGIILFIINIRFDRRKKRQAKLDAFFEPLSRLKTIIETKSIPDHASYDGFITALFTDQDSSMSVIRSRMNRKTKANLDIKWKEYKEKREGYRHYWETNLKGKFSVHKDSDQLITLVNELIDIAKKI